METPCKSTVPRLGTAAHRILWRGEVIAFPKAAAKEKMQRIPRNLSNVIWSALVPQCRCKFVHMSVSAAVNESISSTTRDDGGGGNDVDRERRGLRDGVEKLRR